jgi:hypothetical protein
MKLEKFIIATGIFSCMAAASAAPGASSAYMTDPQTSYNQDQTTETFNMVNFVSCLIRGMAPEKKINQPRYLAFVDEYKCDSASDSTSDTGASATPRTKYARSLLTATLNEKNELIIKGLLRGTNENGSINHYRITATITSGPNVAPPYGIWDMDFCGTPAGSENQPCTHKGFVRVNTKQLKVYDIKSTQWSNKGNVVLQSATSGYGAAELGSSWNGTNYSSKINFSFDTGKYLRSIKQFSNNQLQSDEASCLSPNINDPDTKFAVWENWLYNANNGERVTYTNQGFQLKNNAGQTVGNVNYWGVNFWNEAAVADRQNGTRLYGPNNAEYVLNKSPGRLEKVTVSDSGLQSIDGISMKFSFWGKDRAVLSAAYAGDQASITKINTITNGAAVIASWNHSSQSFVIGGFQACDSEGCDVTTLPTASITYADLTDRSGSLQVDGFGAWIDGASINYNSNFSYWDNLNNTSRVKVIADVVLLKESREIVAPPDAETLFAGRSLACVGTCYSPSGNILTQTSPQNWPPTTFTAYTWDVNTKAPKASNNVTLDFTNKTTYPSGGWTRLFDSSALTAMDCGYWDNQANQYLNTGGYCEWGYTQRPNTVYYNWQSSHNDWDQYKYLTLPNSNTALTFNPPLLLKYVAPDIGNLPTGVNTGYAGKEVRIESPAAGELWLPGSCIDRTTREVATCSETTDWVNDLYMPFSQTHGRVTLVDNTTGQPTNTQYLVKWLKRGVVYARKNSSVCSGLSLDPSNGLSLPSDADWKNPALSIPWDAQASDFDANPVVIDGVLQ